jgi:phytoene desaturase
MGKKVVVAGAGLGGLSAALMLKTRGFDVLILEQNRQAGGKAGERIQDGFRWDTGPSLITMPFVIDELFRESGARRQDYLTFEAIDPLCRYFFSGNPCTLDASSNREVMRENLSRFSPEDGKQWNKFLNYTQKLYRLTADLFLYSPIHEIQNLLTFKNLSRLPALFQIDAFRSMHQAVSGYFNDPKIRQVMDRYATYVGADPWKAPATLNIITYVEYGMPAVYIKGGIARLSEALAKRCEEIGVEIRFNTPVREILHNGKKVTGIQTDNDVIPTSVIVANSDAVSTFESLIRGKDKTKKRLTKLEPSLSGLVFFWGIKGTFPQLAHHNIFFADNYRKEFHHLFVTRDISSDLTVYIAVTSKKDPEHAPGGCENWFVLINMPCLSGNQDWDKWVPEIRENVLKKLAESGLDVRENILTESIMDPRDMKTLYSSNKGSIYGISSNTRSTAFRRPANRNRDLKGLYFCGGSSHPGGGVPLVILSGKITAELVSRHERIDK